MFKSFVLGLYASGHSLHVRVTQTFAVNRFRTGAIYSMHSKTTHRLSFKRRCKITAFWGHEQVLKLIVNCCVSALSKTKIVRAKTDLKRKIQKLKQTRFSF